MLSEKQFRERAKVELRQIGDQVTSLATDRDIYWKLEREVIARNPELQNPNAFIDMVRGAYADAMAARAVRLLDKEISGPSLPRILAQVVDYPQLLHDKVSEREFADDRATLQHAADQLKGLQDPHFAHHERTPSALASTHRAIDEAIDAMIATLKTYYWVVAEGHLDLGVKCPDDPLEIFRQPWLGPGPGQ
jgi:hypothetical protein